MYHGRTNGKKGSVNESIGPFILKFLLYWLKSHLMVESFESFMLCVPPHPPKKVLFKAKG